MESFCYTFEPFFEESGEYQVVVLKCLPLTSKFILNHENRIQFYGHGYQYLIRCPNICDCGEWECDDCFPVSTSVNELFRWHETWNRESYRDFIVETTSVANDKILTNYLKSCIILHENNNNVSQDNFYTNTFAFTKLSLSKHIIKSSFFSFALPEWSFNYFQKLTNSGRNIPELLIPDECQYLCFSMLMFNNHMLLYIMTKSQNKETQLLFAVYLLDIKDGGCNITTIQSYFKSRDIQFKHINSSYRTILCVNVCDLLKNDPQALSTTIPNVLKLFDYNYTHFFADTFRRPCSLYEITKDGLDDYFN
jgi:hypothetical protein